MPRRAMGGTSPSSRFTNPEHNVNSNQRNPNAHFPALIVHRTLRCAHARLQRHAAAWRTTACGTGTLLLWRTARAAVMRSCCGGGALRWRAAATRGGACPTRLHGRAVGGALVPPSAVACDEQSDAPTRAHRARGLLAGKQS